MITHSGFSGPPEVSIFHPVRAWDACLALCSEVRIVSSALPQQVSDFHRNVLSDAVPLFATKGNNIKNVFFFSGFESSNFPVYWDE